MRVHIIFPRSVIRLHPEKNKVEKKTIKNKRFIVVKLKNISYFFMSDRIPTKKRVTDAAIKRGKPYASIRTIAISVYRGSEYTSSIPSLSQKP